METQLSHVVFVIDLEITRHKLAWLPSKQAMF